MTDFATEADVINGLTKSPSVGFDQLLYKTSIATTANQHTSGWTMAGNPGAGAAPTTWAHPTNATAGAWNKNHNHGAAGTTCRILYADLRLSVANQPLVICDRLGHMAGLSGLLTTTQTVGATLTTPAADGRCEANGGDVDWWVEFYVNGGATVTNATIAVTYSDNSTGDIVQAWNISAVALKMVQIVPAVAGLSIKSVNSITLSANTGSAGNFGVTATERKFQCSVPLANTSWVADWQQLGMPDLGTNACLFGRFWATTTATGTVIGNIRAGVA